MLVIAYFGIIVSETSQNPFACKQCGRRFRWTPKLAGRRVQCKCGAPVTCPPMPPTPLSKPAEAPRAEPQDIKNIYLPISLLAGGIVIETIAAALQHWNSFAATLGGELEGIAIGMFFMMCGLLIVSKTRQIDLGNFGQMIYKLAAIAVAPVAVITLITPVLYLIPLGGLIGLVVVFALYFALIGVLFDLDESQTWECVMVIFLIHLAVYFLAKYLHFP